MFNDYKTYIVAGLLGASKVAQYLGFITPGVADVLEGLLIGSGIATLRHGVSKAAIKTEEKAEEVKAVVAEVAPLPLGVKRPLL